MSQKHPLPISSFSLQQWEEQLRTVLQAPSSNKTIRTSKSYPSTSQSQKGFGFFLFFFFPGARLNKSWMSHSTLLFQHLTRIALSNSRKQ